jgi:hypothetical protein
MYWDRVEMDIDSPYEGPRPHRINCIVVLLISILAAAVSPRVKLLATQDDLLNCLFLRDLVWLGPVCFCTRPFHALPALALSYIVHFE